jgi:hypothetical protein
MREEYDYTKQIAELVLKQGPVIIPTSKGRRERRETSFMHATPQNPEGK